MSTDTKTVDDDSDEHARRRSSSRSGDGGAIGAIDARGLRIGPSRGSARALWGDVKRDDSKHGAIHPNRSNAKRASTAPPAMLLTPLRIQSRERPTAISAKPIAATAAAAATPAVIITSPHELMKRISAYEHELRTAAQDEEPFAPLSFATLFAKWQPLALRKACAAIVTQYPLATGALSIDSRMWKSWYKEILSRQNELHSATAATTDQATLRRTDASAATRKLEDVLTHCRVFYTHLTSQLQQQLNVLRAAAGHSCNDSLLQRQRIALRHSLLDGLVALGDTARYAHTHNLDGYTDWREPQRLYERAQRLAPASGRVFNQLALVANHRGDALETLYLYARSLASASPVASRNNFDAALKRVKLPRHSSDTSDTTETIANARARVATLFVASVRALKHEPTTQRASHAFHTHTTALLSALTCCLRACVTQLLAREGVDVLAVGATLRQLVRTLMFLIHDFQSQGAFDRSASVRWDALGADTLCNDNVQRVLGLVFAVVAAAMRECTRVVTLSTHIGAARELLNALLPPVTEWLAWLELQPSLLTALQDSSRDSNASRSAASLAVDATQFVGNATQFVTALEASLLADRLLDQAPATLCVRKLPEDREIEGFMPLAGRVSTDSVTAAVATMIDVDDVEAVVDDDALLDARMWRVLNFRDFLDAQHRALTSVERNASDTQPRATMTTTTSSVPASPAPESLPSVDALVLPPSPLSSLSPLTSPSTMTSTSPQGRLDIVTDTTLAFAAVMAIGADKTLFDAMTTPSSPNADTRKCLIVIDASNVAMRHGRGQRFSCIGIRLAVDYYVARGHRVVGFLPDYLLDAQRVDARRQAARNGDAVPPTKLPDDVALLQRMVAQGLLVPTPASDYDDAYCIEYAGLYDGCVVTNDQFRDHVEAMTGPRERKAAMRVWLTAHRVSYTWVRNEFLPNPSFRYPKAVRV